MIGMSVNGSVPWHRSVQWLDRDSQLHRSQFPFLPNFPIYYYYTQFHPLLQSSLIESYYVSFYMCINVGALVGGIVVPVVAQYDITLAYTYPVAMLCMGVLLFVLGTPRYVRHKPAGDFFAGLKQTAVKWTPRLGKKMKKYRRHR